MTFGLTSTGFNRKRLVDVKAEIESSLKVIFGDDIDLDSQSGFGQLIGLFAEAFADQWESQETVYNSEYPSTAQGVQLSNVVMYNGLDRQEEQKSSDTLTIIGAEGTVIPAGSKAATSITGEKFVTLSEVTIPVNGTIDVESESENFGVIIASAGSITVISTPIFGWTSVTNALDAELGREEETDAELRTRREGSVQSSGQNLTDSLFGQLLNIDGVDDAVVISNGTDGTVGGIPAHQFESTILGGDDDEIAEVIWNNTPQGISSFGDETVEITDSQDFPQDVKFTRPANIDIYFAMDITTDTSFPAGGAADIKEAVVSYGIANFKIGEDVIMSSFYVPINTIPGVTSIILTIGLSSSPVGTSNIVIAADERSNYDVTQVEVNIV